MPFQAYTRGLGMYPLWINGDYCIQNGMVNWCESLGLICTAVVWLLERKQMDVIIPQMELDRAHFHFSRKVSEDQFQHQYHYDKYNYDKQC